VLLLTLLHLHVLLLLVRLLQLLALLLLLFYLSLLLGRCQHTARSSCSNDRLPLCWLQPAGRSFAASLLLFRCCLLLQLTCLLLRSQYALQHLMHGLLYGLLHNLYVTHLQQGKQSKVHTAEDVRVGHTPVKQETRADTTEHDERPQSIHMVYISLLDSSDCSAQGGAHSTYIVAVNLICPGSALWHSLPHPLYQQGSRPSLPPGNVQALQPAAAAVQLTPGAVPAAACVRSCCAAYARPAALALQQLLLGLLAS
jgi:hypothetical protein